MASRQTRIRCRDCRREWCDPSRAGSGSFGLQAWDACPGCGSQALEPLEFEGLFDSDTPSDIFERVGARRPTPAEDEARAAAVRAQRARHVIEPPLTLKS